jgi:hypothetical protein
MGTGSPGPGLMESGSIPGPPISEGGYPREAWVPPHPYGRPRQGRCSRFYSMRVWLCSCMYSCR